MRYTGDTGAASAAWMLAASCGETVSSAKARLSRQGARTAPALRVMRTAESGARGAAFKGYPVESAGPILNNNDAHSLRKNIVFGRRGAELPGGERRGAKAAGRADRLGARRAVRRRRGDACLGAPSHSRGVAPLAQDAVEPGGVGRAARVPSSARRRALRRGDRLAGAPEERGAVFLGIGQQARHGCRQRARAARCPLL